MSRSMLTRLALSAAALTSAALPAAAQDIFLNDALSVGADASSDILIQNGRIAAMGPSLEPADGVDVIDGTWVSANLVAPMSTLGLVDIGAESGSNDITANTELFNASILAADSFNPRAVHIANARRRGIVYAVVAPNPAGDSIFGGIGLTASLDGFNESILDETALMHISLGQSGTYRAGGSRGAALAQLRGALDDARRPYAGQDEGDVLRRRDARAIRDVVAGRVPLLISANRASDLLRIIDLKSDYGSLDIIIVGAKEAHLVADDLANANIKVIVDPHDNLPENFDGVNASFDNVNVLHAAGVDFAISNLSSLGVSNAGNLTQHAGNAVGNGLPAEAALAAITTTPARWFGIDLGDMRTNSPANLTVWDGNPLDAMSAPIAIYKDGESLSLESRMSALRDRYNPLRRDEAPHKYR